MFSRQEGLEREYQGLLTRISELQNTIETERSTRIDIGEIDRKFSTIHERITPLQNALSGQTELHSKHTNFQSGLAELTERMSSLKEEIQSERSSFVKAGEFNNKLTLLEQRIKQEMESVLSSSAKFEEFENKFVQLEQRISELHSAFVFESEIHERIAALETAQTGHTQNIKDLEKLVGEELQKATDPARLESHFTHLHQQLDTVYEKLRFEEKHRREIDSLKDKITVLSDTHEGLKKFTDNEHTTRIDNENAASSRFDEFEKKITSIAGILEKMELFASERSRLNDRQYDELVNQIDDLHVSVDRERKSREAFVQLEQRFEEAHLRFDEDRRRFEAKLSEMTHIISGLQTSIDQERRERELLKERQVEVAKRHFIGVLEKGWVNGKPSGEDALEIQRLAELFSVPDETLVQLERDIKRKMYTRAAKAAISDQKIIKDPAFSLEGLRSRYGVTMEEYVEFESNFLHELISQQFSGTVMLVSGNTAFREELRQKLTSTGFAVVIAAAPDIALEKIEIINPQLIISETEFPTMQVSGLNLLNVLRKNKRFAHLPFILLSGPDELPRVQAAIYRPNESVLTKPIVFNTLLSVMNIQLIRLREHITSQSL
jgi:CheY-like chemotaxis protein